MSEYDDVNSAMSGWKKSTVGTLRLMVIAIGCGIVLSGCAGKSNGSYFSGTQSMPLAVAAPAHAAEDKLGIRLEGLRLSAAGYMLDFRYRVIDPAKAAPLLDKKIRPYLLDEASGAQLGVPDTAKLGQLRTTARNKIVPDQDYFILFANPARFVQAGNRMTLVMGDLRIENLAVE
ncbi:MAG TPA: hypothetical protein DFK12_00470 [Gallionellaceae bacterium]|nr:hypothetical protein [Gallionellaceae bacterium]